MAVPIDDSGFTCFECAWYKEDNIPDTCGCGECRRFPPTAIKKCDQTYAGGYYPVISECNRICGEFLFKRRPTFEEMTGMTPEEFRRKQELNNIYSDGESLSGW